MSRVSRVIVAGNLILKDKDLDYNSVGAYAKQEQFKNVYAAINLKMKLADEFLQSVSSTVSIDLMPGDNDPVQAFLPQQPISKYYFPKSSMNSSFARVSNPYIFLQDGIHVLGVSGKGSIQAGSRLTDGS